MIKQGDILLISYNFDPICWFIQYKTKSRWSHIAWALNKRECISAHGTGIEIDKIKKFNNKWLYKIKVIRLKKIKYNQIKKVTRILKKQQNKYNYLKFIANFFYIGFTGKRKFNVPTCALFVASALMKVGYYIRKKNITFIVPEDFNQLKNKIELINE